MNKNNTEHQDVIDPESMIFPDYLKDDRALNLLNEGVCVFDAAGVIINYNQKASELWGRNPTKGDDAERFCGAYRLFDAMGNSVPPDESPTAKFLATGVQHDRDITIERPDRSRITVRESLIPVRNNVGSVIAILNYFYELNGKDHEIETEGGVDSTRKKQDGKLKDDHKFRSRSLTVPFDQKIKDNTARMNQENHELTLSEDRYHKMIEEVEDYAIILLDENGIIQNWNKGAEKIKGYKESEIVGKSFSNFYLPKDREDGLPQKLLLQAKETGKAIHEGWRMRKDGSTFWGSIVLTALHNSKKDIIGYSKVTRDLTERKLFEDRMKEYTSQLEFQNRELEQFAFAASHDMKEPLRKIHLYNAAIAENPNNILDEKSKEYLSRSLSSVTRMTELIEDLLTYSRATGNSEASKNIDLNEIVNEVRIMYNEEIEQKSLCLRSDHLPVIHGIPFQIRQLMMNLINNAIKYKSTDRKLEINITTAIKKGHEIMEKEAEADKDYHVISISDNGIGFDPNYAEKIFNIFQRLNNNSLHKGSGIGLAICKKIIQNHHGFIHATAKENEWALFEFYIPVER